MDLLKVLGALDYKKRLLRTEYGWKDVFNVEYSKGSHKMSLAIVQLPFYFVN